MQKKIIAILFIFILISSSIFPILKVNAESGSIRYQSHLKDLGWIETVYDGAISGTTGQSRRMEAISIALSGVDGNLTYQVHVEDYGWMSRVSEGHVAGTTGQCRRMEAIIINLDNSSYNIKYRVHVKDYGWMNWVSSGQVAGTTGECRRIEAIQIVVEKKNNVENYNKPVTNNDIVSNTGNTNANSNATSNNTAVANNTNVDIVGSNKILGIDVSKHQGTIDWTKVKNSGVKFAMIRCAYRGYTEGKISEDAQFKNNVNGAINNGIKVGLYFYSSAINEEEAIEEANYVVNLINKYGIKNNIIYPIVIDVEDFEGTRNYSLTIRQRTDVVKAFCNTIKNNGYIPMVYSYTYFLENKLYMDELSNYDTWIADYYGNTWYKRPFTIWQYTDKGQIEGINGNVDLNYSYKNY